MAVGVKFSIEERSTSVSAHLMPTSPSVQVCSCYFTIYYGRFREGFDGLQLLHATTCPFADLPNSTKKSRGGEGITAEEPEDIATFQWVRPKRVAQIRFVEWTADDHLRHAAFLGLREDKKPLEVKREG